MHAVQYSGRARNEIHNLDSTIGILILRAIEEKLVRAPEAFGKPLRRSLRLIRVLRVGDWRILFQLKERVVYVVTVRHRKKGYADLS